ncbi:MAG TPA: YdcF family protein [Tepidiformaceae bacterium]
MIYLHKILPVFVLPVGITLLLVLAGVRFRRRWLIWSGVAVLWLSSTPFISGLAVRAAEGWAERGLAADASEADAIVVLSEGRIVAPGRAAISEWIDADRFFGGVELFKAGKSPLLVFTGGASPWEPTAALEGDVLAGYAKAMGVPDGQIVKTPRVTNTAEEALAVATLLRERFSGPTWRGGAPRILLVTSAFHMPRACMLFERAGISVIPFPVDFKVPAGRTVSVVDFLPTGAALEKTEMAMREWYGRLFYLVVK